MNKSAKRDLFLFALLLIMIRTAWYLPTTIKKTPILFSVSPTTEPTDSPDDQPFSVHKIDPALLAYIDELHMKIDQTMMFIDPSSSDMKQLQNMQEHLASYKRQYCHTSPAIVLLGPIGYASVVLKEQRIEREILVIINRLNSTLHQYIPLAPSYEPVHTIGEGIEITNVLLTQCQSSSR